MSEWDLDSSAILALLNRKPGDATVAQALSDGAAMGSVNFAEAVTSLTDAGLSEAEIRAQLRALELKIVPFDIELAYQTGRLRLLTRQAGLSLGDRACLALAQQLGLPVLTADRAWAGLKIGMVIRLIR